MSSTAFFAYASPSSAAAEGDFLQWYSDVHIPEVRAAIPEITQVTRYLLWSPTAEAGTPNRYVTVYEVNAEDPTAVAARLGAAAPGLTMTPAIDLEKNVIEFGSVVD
ncbi:hypothetical protein ACLRGF_02065 [Mycetocola zhadangensis]|uniref:hypothetical protein n=1 Tax=Mycetocola zhadangensis TaxID=1164595 RepID=UPI003A4D9832